MAVVVRVRSCRPAKPRPAVPVQPPRSFRAVGVPNIAIYKMLMASGVDVADIPGEPFRMLRPKEAMRLLGIGKTQFYQRAKDGVIKLVPLDGRAK